MVQEGTESLRISFFRPESLFWKWAFGALIFTLCVVYFVCYRPWLQGLLSGVESAAPLLSPADAETYFSHGAFTPINKLPWNLLGPVVLVKSVSGSSDAIFFINIYFLTVFLRKFVASFGQISYFVFFLIFINPLFFVQIFYVNKEIFTLYGLMASILYLKEGNIIDFFMVVLFGLLSKYQILVLLLSYISISHLSYRKKNIFIIILVIFITIGYRYLPNMSYYEKILFVNQSKYSLGVSFFLQFIASELFLFPLVVIPRLLLSIFEGGVGIIRYGFENLSHLFYFISGILIFIFSFFNLIRKKFQFKYDGFYLLLLFILMSAVIPFPHHRYFLPVYPVLIFLFFLSDSDYVDDIPTLEKS